jgi:hypothetical protein
VVNTTWFPTIPGAYFGNGPDGPGWHVNGINLAAYATGTGSHRPLSASEERSKNASVKTGTIFDYSDAEIMQWFMAPFLNVPIFYNGFISSASADPTQPGNIGAYLVRQNAAGDWVIVGQTSAVLTKHGFVNGITGSLGDHVALAVRHLPKGITEFTLFNNPTAGFWADIWETGLDKLV